MTSYFLHPQSSSQTKVCVRNRIHVYTLKYLPQPLHWKRLGFCSILEFRTGYVDYYFRMHSKETIRQVHKQNVISFTNFLPYIQVSVLIVNVRFYFSLPLSRFGEFRVFSFRFCQQKLPAMRIQPVIS